ncbi:beta-N-acetylhexosaminidase [Streptomyces beijiangensis]|uniref:Family 20 glycosylhydrolase n=1 Tax=Streptomyces beijiangensis TaxID=163361 RepID=A0A939F2I2_9ACTN|nr:glycoside hydrolase family 20 protein [Streptomyces beijiangensis]MBO0510656.1 family 20 glycosylhydrolase [Streptomyces beijiangensis]
MRQVHGALAAVAVLVAGAAVTAAVVVWPEDDTWGGHGPPGDDDRAPASATYSPSPTPSRNYPLSRAPRTIPSVREHEAARGPGWQPEAGSRVLVAAGSKGLADEGQLLASELKIPYAYGATARPGDVELALAQGRKAAPESYTLDTRDRQVRITGPDEAGVFYGTRTLKQSFLADRTMPEGVVRDRPDRPQRGLNLDIARKNFTAGWIEDRLREMADLKLNQLGLHFSDDQGFRIASDSHPEVVSREHLTKAQVRSIVALAGRLHIEVVPEIDSPGHLGAVLRTHPELELRNAKGVAARGAVDISKPRAAQIVDELLKEYAGLFSSKHSPGTYWHLGGDEYRALMADDPEASYPQLATAARRSLGSRATVQDLATAWLNARGAVLRPYGKKLKAWNDGYFRGGTVAPDPSREVEYWTGKEYGAREPVEYLKEGRRLVNLNDEYLYYVLGEPNDFRYPTGRRIYEEWTPRVLRGTSAVPARYSGQILGGRFAVWCDYANAQTPAQVAAGIRMPLRATAQKLWDPRKPVLGWKDFGALAKRLG